MRNTLCAVVLLMSVAFSASAQAADGTLAAARDLYVSASYDDALAMLSGLSTASPTTEELPVNRPVSNALPRARSGAAAMRTASSKGC
mgnify:CR=1 FL=1